MAYQTVAKVAESFDGAFECQHCGHEAGAVVFAKSSGAARGIGAEAEREARENAENDANALASRTLQFVKCPKCGRTDPTGRSYRIQATIGSIMLGIIGAGLIYVYASMRAVGADDASTARWGSIGFGVFLALLLYWKWGRPWRSPDKRTVFRSCRCRILPLHHDDAGEPRAVVASPDAPSARRRVARWL